MCVYEYEWHKDDVRKYFLQVYTMQLILNQNVKQWNVDALLHTNDLKY